VSCRSERLTTDCESSQLVAAATYKPRDVSQLVPLSATFFPPSPVVSYTQKPDSQTLSYDILRGFVNWAPDLRGLLTLTLTFVIKQYREVRVQEHLANVQVCCFPSFAFPCAQLFQFGHYWCHASKCYTPGSGLTHYSTDADDRSCRRKTVVRLVTLDCTRGIINSLYHCRHSATVGTCESAVCVRIEYESNQKRCAELQILHSSPQTR